MGAILSEATTQETGPIHDHGVEDLIAIRAAVLAACRDQGVDTLHFEDATTGIIDIAVSDPIEIVSRAKRFGDGALYVRAMPLAPDMDRDQAAMLIHSLREKGREADMPEELQQGIARAGELMGQMGGIALSIGYLRQGVLHHMILDEAPTRSALLFLHYAAERLTAEEERGGWHEVDETLPLEEMDAEDGGETIVDHLVDSDIPRNELRRYPRKHARAAAMQLASADLDETDRIAVAAAVKNAENMLRRM